MSSGEYYSYGKLMLCGEYAVLGGATAFVLPVNKGQKLTVTELDKNPNPKLLWKAIDNEGRVWFEAIIGLEHFILEYSNDPSVAIQLLRFLISARALNPDFLRNQMNIRAESRLEFGLDEGFGSSSTLTNNIAQWAGINPFELHFAAFKGSGFDVAAAREGKPLLYSMNGAHPTVETVSWNKPFRDKLFFVHLNRKQNSREEIYKIRNPINPSIIAKITRISKLISVNDDYFEFCLLLELAETETSALLEQPPVKQKLFGDFHGTVKSLGAWGGDYVLATGENTEVYFKEKGYHRITPFNQLIP